MISKLNIQIKQTVTSKGHFGGNKARNLIEFQNDIFVSLFGVLLQLLDLGDGSPNGLWVSVIHFYCFMLAAFIFLNILEQILLTQPNDKYLAHI